MSAIEKAFSGKRVWITGASSGIGRALAAQCAAVGARCLLSARNESTLTELCQQLDSAQSGAVQALPMDLSASDTLAECVVRAVDLLGGVDVLINNAGISQRGLALETPLAVDRQIMETNFFGTVTLTKAVLPYMLAHGGGQIGVVSSVMGHMGACRRSTYAASKHALHGFFESLRAELAGQGIHITMLSPGYVRTDVSTRALMPDGSSHGQMDPGQARGLSPETCALRMLKAMAGKRAEAYIGGLEIGGIYLKRWLPGLIRRIMRGRDIS